MLRVIGDNLVESQDDKHQLHGNKERRILKRKAVDRSFLNWSGHVVMEARSQDQTSLWQLPLSYFKDTNQAWEFSTSSHKMKRDLGEKESGWVQIHSKY